MDAKRLADKLVLWIRDKVMAVGSKGIVVGMSGGIDSSVLAVLCQRAFPKNTLGVILPCFSSPEDKEHALLVARQFSIPTVEAVLDNIYTALLQTLPSYKVDSTTSRLAQANLKVRLRMLTFYYVANQLNYMVVGSSDRSEIAVGYFTKYGDGGVDIMLLGNLLKSQVKELARSLDIPKPIIVKPPSPGLWEGQTAEGEIGFTYDELDRYLLTGEASDQLREKIKSRMASSAHKRCLPPIPDPEIA